MRSVCWVVMEEVANIKHILLYINNIGGLNYNAAAKWGCAASLHNKKMLPGWKMMPDVPDVVLCFVLLHRSFVLEKCL